MAAGAVSVVLAASLLGCGSAPRSAGSPTAAGTAASKGNAGPVFALVYNGSGWAASSFPGVSGSAPAGAASLEQFNLVACPAIGVCLAGGSLVRRADGGPVQDLVSRLTGGEWSAPVSLPPPPEGIVGLSCSSTASCLAIGSASTFVLSPAGWARGPSFPGNASRLASCSRPDFCLELEPTTFAYETERGGVWTTPLPIAPLRGTNVLPNMLSCTGPTFCVGRSDLHAYWIFDGAGWSDGYHLPVSAWEGFDPKALSCAGPHFCVAVGADLVGHDEAVTFNGSVWTPPTIVADPGSYTQLTSVACPDSGFCVAVGTASQPAQDFEVTYSDHQWLRPVELAKTSDQPAVACASNRYCVAVTGATLAMSSP